MDLDQFKWKNRLLSLFSPDRTHPLFKQLHRAISESKSGAVQVAKKAIRGMLPVSRYVSYKLEKDGDWILNIGGVAAQAADQDGVKIGSDSAELSLAV